MAEALTKQGAENREFIRRLLRRKQPAFFAALQLAADLVDQELGGASSTSPADQDSGAPAQTAGRGMARREGWNWRMSAACRDTDPELFFPVGTAGPALVQLGQAKRICATCPVRLACLDWALASGQEVGVWGGMSEDERRILWRLRKGTVRAPRTALG